LIQSPLQCVEPLSPQASVRREPLVHGAQRVGPDAVDPALRVHLDVDETGLAKHPQVLGNGRLADRQRRNQVACGARSFQQQIEDLLAVRLGERGEGGNHDR